MPNETSQQPFTPDQPRSTDDKELVGEVLGERAAEEMEELAGENLDSKSPDPPAGLDVSITESDEIKEMEQVVSPEQRRQEYIEWASFNGLNEEWIERHFLFKSNGTVEFLNSMRGMLFNDTNGFPESLKVFRGHLDTSGLPWTKEAMNSLCGKTILGDLIVSSDSIENIPPDVHCERIQIVAPFELSKHELESKTLEHEVISKLKKIGYENIYFRYFE